MFGLIRVEQKTTSGFPTPGNNRRLRAATFDYWETLIEERERGDASLEKIVASLFHRWGAAWSLPAEDRFLTVFHRHLTASRQQMTEQLREAPLDQFFTNLFAELEVPDAPDRVEQAVTYISGLLQESTVVLPGAVEFLSFLKARGIKLGLISNTQMPARFRHPTIEKQGLLSYFDAIVLSSEVSWRKPRPEIFLETLRQLEVEPEECLHFGDNIRADIEGAKQVGMLAVQVLASRHAPPPEADLILRDWQTALAFFQRLI
jgi:HAD superfamily hydrolase (TIGR01549 family)